MNINTSGLVAIGSVVVLVIAGLLVWQYRVSQENEGEALQERVEQIHSSAQNSLSTCLDQGQVAAQVADAEFDRLKEILTDAVSARYVSQDGTATSASEALGGGQLFSAVVESYPEIDQASFQNLQDVVVGCRDEYQGSQDRLFNEIREFETWIQTGGIFSQGIREGFPTDGLEVIDYSTGETVTGQEALNYMSRVIIVGDAREAYAEGELGEQDLFGEDD